MTMTHIATTEHENVLLSSTSFIICSKKHLTEEHSRLHETALKNKYLITKTAFLLMTRMLTYMEVKILKSLSEKIKNTTKNV